MLFNSAALLVTLINDSKRIEFDFRYVTHQQKQEMHHLQYFSVSPAFLAFARP